MNALRRALLVSLAGASAGCDFLHDPTAVPLQETVVVHAVLSTGAEQASVLITRVHDRTEPVIGETYPFEPGIDPLSGAEVRLIAGGDTLRLAEAAPGRRACYVAFSDPDGEETPPPAAEGCYGARVPGGIRPNVRYSLRIRLPDGRTIDGETIPPATPDVVEPVSHARVTVPQDYGFQPSLVRVSVRPGSEGSALGLWLETAAVFVGGRRVEDVRCSIGAPREPPEPGTTATTAIYGLGCERRTATSYTPVTPDSVHARLYVTVYDPASVRYRAAVEAEQATGASVTQGISGALGLFGSEGTDQRTLTLVPRPSTAP